MIIIKCTIQRSWYAISRMFIFLGWNFTFELENSIKRIQIFQFIWFFSQLFSWKYPVNVNAISHFYMHFCKSCASTKFLVYVSVKKPESIEIAICIGWFGGLSFLFLWHHQMQNSKFCWHSNYILLSSRPLTPQTNYRRKIEPPEKNDLLRERESKKQLVNRICVRIFVVSLFIFFAVSFVFRKKKSTRQTREKSILPVHFQWIVCVSQKMIWLNVQYYFAE